MKATCVKFDYRPTCVYYHRRSFPSVVSPSPSKMSVIAMLLYGKNHEIRLVEKCWVLRFVPGNFRRRFSPYCRSESLAPIDYDRTIRPLWKCMRTATACIPCEDRIVNFHRKLYDVCATLLFCLLDPCAASLLQSDEQAPNSSSTTRQQVAARGRRPAINADVLPCSCQLGMQEVEVWEITTCSLPTAVSAGVEGGKQRGKKARSDINRCRGWSGLLLLLALTQVLAGWFSSICYVVICCC